MESEKQPARPNTRCSVNLQDPDALERETCAKGSFHETIHLVSSFQGGCQDFFVVKLIKNYYARRLFHESFSVSKGLSGHA